MGFALQDTISSRLESQKTPTVGDYLRTFSAGSYQVAGAMAGAVSYAASQFDRMPIMADIAYATESLGAYANSLGEDVSSFNTPAAQRIASAQFGSAEWWQHPFHHTGLSIAQSAPTMVAGVTSAIVATPTVGMLLVEGLAGAQSAGATYLEMIKDLDGMYAEGKLNGNPLFEQLKAGGLSDQEALAQFKKQAVGAKPAVLFAVTALLAKYSPAGQIAGKLAPKVGSPFVSLPKRVGVSAGLGAGEESIQNLSEEAASQMAQVETGAMPEYDIGALASAFGSGAVVGGAMGAGAGVPRQRGATPATPAGGTVSRAAPPPAEVGALPIEAPAGTGAPEDIVAAVRASTPNRPGRFVVEDEAAAVEPLSTPNRPGAPFTVEDTAAATQPLYEPGTPNLPGSPFIVEDAAAAAQPIYEPRPRAAAAAGGPSPADLASSAPVSGTVAPAATTAARQGVIDDENYQKAKSLVQQEGKASPNFIQRRLGLTPAEMTRTHARLIKEKVVELDPEVRGRYRVREQPTMTFTDTSPGEVPAPPPSAMVPPSAEAFDAPAPQWMKANNATAIKLADQLGLTEQISRMATAGMVAKDISKALKGKLDTGQVRAVRDSLGIAPAGPQPLPGGGVIGKEAPAAGTTASMQLMMTRKMRSQLQGLGYTLEEIGQMVPQDAADLIASGTAKTPAAAPSIAEVPVTAEETVQAPAEMSEMEEYLRGEGFSEDAIRRALEAEGITPSGVTLKVSEEEEEAIEAAPAKKPRKKPAAKKKPEPEPEPEEEEPVEEQPTFTVEDEAAARQPPEFPPRVKAEEEPEEKPKKGRKKGEKPREKPAEKKPEPEPEEEPAEEPEEETFEEPVEREERDLLPDDIREDIERQVEEDVAREGIKGRGSKFEEQRRRFYEAEYEKQGYDTSTRGPRVLEAVVDTSPEGVARGAILQEWAEKNAEIKRNSAAIGEKELFEKTRDQDEENEEILRESGALEAYNRKKSRQRKSYWHGVDRKNALGTEIFVRHALIPQKNLQPLGDGKKADAFWEEFRARLDGIIADMRRTQESEKVAFGKKVTVATHGAQGWLLRARSIRSNMANNNRPVTEAVAFLAGEATNREELLQHKPMTNVWLDMSRAMTGTSAPVAFDTEGKPINPTDLIIAEDRDWSDIWDDLGSDAGTDAAHLHAMEIASIRRNMVRPTPTVIDKMNRAKIYAEIPTVSLHLDTQLAREVYEEMRATGGLNLKPGVSFAERGFTPGMKAAAQALRTNHILKQRIEALRTTKGEFLPPEAVFRNLPKKQREAREQEFKDANKAFMDFMRAKAKQNLGKRSQLKAIEEMAKEEMLEKEGLGGPNEVTWRRELGQRVRVLPKWRQRAINAALTRVRNVVERDPEITDKKLRKIYEDGKAEAIRSFTQAQAVEEEAKREQAGVFARRLAARRKPLTPQVGQKLPEEVRDALKKQNRPWRPVFTVESAEAARQLEMEDIPPLTPSQRKLLQQENDELTAMTRALPVQAPRRAVSSRMRRLRTVHTAEVDPEDLEGVAKADLDRLEAELKVKPASTVAGIRSNAGMNQFEEGDADAVESIVLGDVTEDNFTTMEQLEALIAKGVAKEERAMTREEKAQARAEREAAERAAEQAAEPPAAKKGPKIDPEEFKRQVAKGAAGGWLKSPYVAHQKVYARILQNTTVASMLDKIDFKTAARGVKGRESAMKFLRDRLIESVGDVKMYVIGNEDFSSFMGDNFDAVGNEAYDGIIVWFKEQGDATNENYILINDDLFSHPDKRIAESVLHEIVHAATVRGIDRDPRLRDYLNNLIDEVMAFHGIKDRKEHYGLGDALEFVAEAMTNPVFQELLASTPLSRKLARQLGIKKGMFATGWDAFLKFVSKSIKLPEDSLSVLHALVSVTERLAADPTGATGVTQPQSEVMKPSAKRGPRTSTVPPVRPKTVKEIAKLSRDTVADYVNEVGLRPSQHVPWLLSLADATQLMRTADRFWGTIANPDPNNPIRKVVKVLNTIATRTNQYMRDGEELITKLYKAARATKPEEWLSFAEFMIDETMANVFADRAITAQPHLGKDPINKPTLAGAQAIAKHPELATRWEALSPELKALRTAMHEFLAARHERMAKLVIGNILAEGARKAGESAADKFDAALVDRVYKKKPTDADKKAIGTVLLTQLYKARELYAARGPYIPLMRRGKYVFVATLKVKPPAASLGGKLMKDADGKPIDNTYEFRGKDGRANAMAYARSLNEHAWVTGTTIDEKTGESWEEMDDGSEMPGSRKKITMKDVDAIRVFRVEVQNKHVEFHDSMRRARAAAAEVAQDPDVLRISTEPQQRRQGPGDRGVDFLSSDINNLLSTLEKRTSFKQMNKSMQGELRKAITDFSLQMMSSTRVHKRRMTRKFVPGASLDIVRNLMDYRRSTSSYMARLEHARDLNDGMRELEASVNDPELNAEGAAGRRALQLQMQWRVEKGSVFKGDLVSSPTLQRLLTTSFISRLASPMYTIMNLLQVPMIAWPVLAARHKAGRTTAAMTKAMKDLGIGTVLKTGGKETLKKLKDPASETANYIDDLKARLRAAGFNHEAELMDSVQLQGVLESDKFERSVSTRGGFATEAGARLDTILNYMEGFSTQMPTAAEVANRSLVLVTAYRLELELNGGDVEAAKRYAEDTNNMVNFTYSEVNTPPWLNHPLAKIPFQFKRFGHGAYQLIGQQIGRAYRNEGGARKEALVSLAYLAAAHVIMAGTLGLPTEPVKGLLLGLYSVGITNFNWQDVENAQRELAADLVGSELGEVLTRGITRPFGFDISSRVGLADMFLAREPNSGDPEEMSAWLQDMAFGAPGAMVKDWWIGTRELVDGDWSAGLPKLVPLKFAKDLIKAYDIGAHGKFTDTGRPSLEPYSFPEAVFRALGATPTREAEDTEFKSYFYSERDARTRMRNSIQQRYADATTAGRISMRGEIERFNRDKPTEAQLSTRKLNEYIARRKTEMENMEGGVTVNRTNRDIVRSGLDVYNTGQP